MFTWELNFWSKFWQELTHASKYWRVVKILTTGQNISNRFDPSIFWVNVFFDKKISHTRSKIQAKFWCQFFASIYWRIFWSCMGPFRVFWVCGQLITEAIFLFIFSILLFFCLFSAGRWKISCPIFIFLYLSFKKRSFLSSSEIQ